MSKKSALKVHRRHLSQAKSCLARAVSMAISKGDIETTFYRINLDAFSINIRFNQMDEKGVRN